MSVNGRVGGHHVDVQWDAERSTFSFHVHLSNGKLAHCSFDASLLLKELKAPQVAQNEHQEEGDLQGDREVLPSPSTPSRKRKQMDEENEAKDHNIKKPRLQAEQKEEGIRKEEGTSINDILPHELVSLMLQYTISDSLAMWAIGRGVCRLWKELMPSNSIVSKRNQKNRRKGRLIRVCREAASKGWLSVLQWRINNPKAKRDWFTLKLMVAEVAEKGQIEVLRLMEGNPNLEDAMAEGAARGGQIPILEWLASRKKPGERKSNWVTDGSRLFDPCEQAAFRGQLEALQWLLRNNCPYDNQIVWMEAAKGGQLMALKWLLGEQGRVVSEKNKSDGKSHNCLLACAAGGNVDVMKWLRDEVQQTYDEDVMVVAAYYGRLEMVKWLKEQGWPWSPTVSWAAASMGRLEVLQWLRENGCPWDQTTCESAAGGSHPEVLEYALKNGCGWDWTTARSYPTVDYRTGQVKVGGKNDVAYLSKGWPLWKWMIENGWTAPARISASVARSGKIEKLQWLKDRKCAWDDEGVTRVGAKKGNLEMLTWMKENGCLRARAVCVNAVEEGHKEVWIWARENGCPFNEELCEKAAKHRKFELLRWLRGQGCQWDTKTTEALAGSLLDKDTFKWAVEEGCPVSVTTAATFGRLNDWETAKWIIEWCKSWDASIGIMATRKGNLDFLSWALAKGYFDPSASSFISKQAAKSGKVEILRWCPEAGIPYHRKCWKFAWKRESTEVLDLLHRHRVPAHPSFSEIVGIEEPNLQQWLNKVLGASDPAWKTWYEGQ